MRIYGLYVLPALLLLACSNDHPTETTSRRLLIKGDIVTMDIPGVIEQGTVVVSLTSGKIEAVLSQSESPVPEAGDLLIETDDYIFPGMIDLHNHVKYNASRILEFPHKWESRYQWQKDTAYKKWIGWYGRALMYKHPYQINVYAEVKGLTGGNTFIQGTNTRLTPASYDLFLINAESLPLRKTIYSSVFVYDKQELPDLEVLGYVDTAITHKNYHAQIFHLAEGYNAESKREFDYFDSAGLLSDRSVLIHGVGFSNENFERMNEVNAHLVWSPTSNLMLYGRTANVAQAKQAGVNISLGSDWSPSGTKSLLHELKVAYLYNQQALNGLFTNEELVEMVTVNPSMAADLADEMGRIKPGLKANLVIFKKRDADPYQSLIYATEQDLSLVLIEGHAVYGEAGLLKKSLPAVEDKELYHFTDISKSLYLDQSLLPDSIGNFHDIRTLLETETQKPGFQENHVLLDPLFPDSLYFTQMKRTTGFDIEQFWKAEK